QCPNSARPMMARTDAMIPTNNSWPPAPAVPVEDAPWAYGAGIRRESGAASIRRRRMAATNATGNVSPTTVVEDAAVRQAWRRTFRRWTTLQGLAERAATYVLTGKDDAALTEVANAQRWTGGYGSHFGLLQKAGLAHRDHKLFLKDHGPHAVPQLARFGQV